MTITTGNAGLFYFGNPHETVPLRLLQDPYLTVRAKYTWQMIRYHAKAFASSLFPSYEKLQELLSDKLYRQEKVSRKIVSQTLLLLRLTRWLTLCDTKRDEKGRVLGNVYIIHDEPIGITDAVHFDSSYLKLLAQSTKHNDRVVQEVAQHIIESIKNDKNNAHFVSYLTLMQKRFNESQDASLNSNRTPAVAKKVMAELLTTETDNKSELSEKEKKLQSSEMELSQKDEVLQSSDMELSENYQSSQMELSENDENIASSQMELSEKGENLLSSDMELSTKPLKSANFHTELSKKHLVSQYSTSTNNIYTKYSTSTVFNNNLLKVFNDLEKQTLENLIRQLRLSDAVVQSVMTEAALRIEKGDIRNPLSYVCSLLRKAKQGDFNEYLCKIKNKTADLAKPTSQTKKQNNPVLTVTRSPEELANMLNKAKLLAEQLRG
ncbi:STY4528 family pathogenicity island replication protein [Gallibacterium anatis]|uniref:STY4528 family pathogenicity island replication protein n=1 Tax=Gallibacterium anatis TaxID=750 RepID=UPI001B3426D8|nr:STY4528 family pathogenicity island replication protein [Gallibacterium anatis]MBP4132448.1 hypothetical protein [Gallibacterium anatis]